MVTKLSDLDIEEVSLVDVPANNKRVIFKSLNKGDKMAKIRKEDKLPPMPPIPGKKPEDEEDEDGLEEAGIPKERHPISEAANTVATDHMNAAETARHKAEMAEHAAEAAMAVAEAAEAAAVEAEAAQAVPEEPVMDAAPEIMPPQEGENPETPGEEAEEEDEEEGEEPEMTKSEDDDEDDEEVPVKDCVGKGKKKPAEKKGGKKPKVEVDLHKALADRDAKIAILEKTAKDAQEKLVMKEYVEKSQKEFGHIPGVSSEQFGAVLKNASEKMDASQYQTLITVLKSVESMLSQSVLTQTIGVKAEARMMDGTAASRLHQKATDIMNTVTKSGEKLTYEKAFVRAMKEAPELYNEYLQGK